MTTNELDLLRSKYPISAAVAKLNGGSGGYNSEPVRPDGDQGSGPAAVAQPVVRNDSLAKASAKKGNRERFSVLVTSVRSRLLDEDNLASKFHVDLLRYAGIIPSDAPGKTSIKTTQRKVQKGEEEHTIIEVTRSEI